jgi:hypothetical protein
LFSSPQAVNKAVVIHNNSMAVTLTVVRFITHLPSSGLGLHKGFLQP